MSVMLSTFLPFFEVQVPSRGKMLFYGIAGLLAMVRLNDTNGLFVYLLLFFFFFFNIFFLDTAWIELQVQEESRPLSPDTMWSLVIWPLTYLSDTDLLCIH